MELPIERVEVNALLWGIFDANWKLDAILGYLLEDENGQEEADPDA